MMTSSRQQQPHPFNLGACRGGIALMLVLLVICIFQQILQTVAQASVDELALESFRGFVTSDPNNALGSWDQTAGVCHWDHVTCNDNQRVISLDLSNQGLVGTISASLGALEFVEYLNLENNCFTGVIPTTLGYLAHLHTLKLDSNNVNGPLPNYVQMMGAIHGTSRRRLRHKKGKSDLKLILGLTGGILASLVLLCISIVLVLKWYMKKKTRCDRIPGLKPKTPVHLNSKKLTALSEKARKSTRNFTIQELKNATDNFSHKKVIGEGGFGLVYKGTLSTGQEVAIKYAHKDAQQGLNEFYNEVELLSKIHHKFLVDLVGYCDQGGEQLLVYEFIPNGNLLEHLCGQRTPALTWRQRVEIAICSAKGLAHLHEGCSPSIIHRDIKPSNILLDNDLLAKVADFGLSKTGPVGGASHVSTGVKGTPGYLDPYYYLSWHLGAYSDVYSFGVILLQLVAAKPAVDRQRKSRSTQYSLIAWAKDCLRDGHFDSIVDPKLRVQGYNRELLLLMVKLGILCTGEAIKERPTMKTIYEALERALKTKGSLPSVTGSPDHSSDSVQDSEELVPESVATAGGGQDGEVDSNGKICFDGRPWVDIKNLAEDQSEEHGHDHSKEQGLENVVPAEGSSSHMSKPSLDISINSPELEVANP